MGTPVNKVLRPALGPALLLALVYATGVAATNTAQNVSVQHGTSGMVTTHHVRRYPSDIYYTKQSFELGGNGLPIAQTVGFEDDVWQFDDGGDLVTPLPTRYCKDADDTGCFHKYTTPQDNLTLNQLVVMQDSEFDPGAVWLTLLFQNALARFDRFGNLCFTTWPGQYACDGNYHAPSIGFVNSDCTDMVYFDHLRVEPYAERIARNEEQLLYCVDGSDPAWAFKGTFVDKNSEIWITNFYQRRVAKLSYRRSPLVNPYCAVGRCRTD
jgi:hypothetical protein